MIRIMLQSHYILIFILVFSLPIIFFFAPHFVSPHPKQLPIPLPDELDDLSLFNHALSSSSSSSRSKTLSFSRLGSHNPTLKIAFLFLTNTDIFFSPLWEKFFKNGNQNLFNLYIHGDPDSHIKDPGGIFKARFISSKHTERSSSTLISAAKRLIASSILDDPLNFYFALLSQSCIPLHSFDYVYNTIVSGGNGNKLGFRFGYRNHKSFIEILDNEITLPSRYVARGENVMLPEVPFEEFRVGSQFFVLSKKHALMVLRDKKLWRKFKLPCYNTESCYPEEHYFPTLLSMQDPKGCTKYTVTRVNWTDSYNGHPHMYRPPEVSPELINTLRQSNFSHDYLFARKFSPDCLKPLMDMADTILFND